jgi:dolichyl-phosphate-mannose-protein mannosyltransferase
MKSWLRIFVTLGLLGFGVELWLVALHGDWGRHYQPRNLLFALVISAIWPLSKRIGRGIDRLDRALAPHHGKIGGFLFVAAAGYLLHARWMMVEKPYLAFHDEHSYMIQSRMLAEGRLWLPPFPPEIRPFFDNFHILNDPVYASIYFPGTALLNVPAIWIGAPFWFMPWLAASGAAAILFLIAADLFGATLGFVGFLTLLGLNLWRYVAFMLLSEMPLLLANMTVIYAWLRWRQKRDWRWALLIGAAAGYGGITRPLDALCVAVPVGIAMLLELRPWRGAILFRTAAAIVLAAMPFLALQVVQNIGITGHATMFPSDLYVARNYPAPMLGFYHIDPNWKPTETSPPKQQALHGWIIPAYRGHTLSSVIPDWIPLPINQWRPGRLYQTLRVVMPNSMLVALLPVGFMGMIGIRRKVIATSLVLFVMGYAAYVFYLDHYVIAIAPTCVILMLMGIDALQRAWPPLRPAVLTFFVLGVGSVAIGALPDFDKWTGQPYLFYETLTANRLMARLPNSPAVVLFRFDGLKDSFHDEPAYNDSTAWPDDAMIVRVHDLGPSEDWKIYDYYAKRQPDRKFYVYDRAAARTSLRALTGPLGTAAQLAAEYPPPKPTSRPAIP